MLEGMHCDNEIVNGWLFGGIVEFLAMEVTKSVEEVVWEVKKELHDARRKEEGPRNRLEAGATDDSDSRRSRAFSGEKAAVGGICGTEVPLFVCYLYWFIYVIIYTLSFFIMSPSCIINYVVSPIQCHPTYIPSSMQCMMSYIVFHRIRLYDTSSSGALL